MNQRGRSVDGHKKTAERRLANIIEILNSERGNCPTRQLPLFVCTRSLTPKLLQQAKYA